MRAWLQYAAVATVVTLIGGAVGSQLVREEAVGGVWFAAGLAYAVQLTAFAGLVAVRRRTEWFLLGWLGGLVLRFATVGVVAIWLTRRPVFPPETALLSLVTFVFVLLLLEPLFLRRGLQTR